LYFSIRPTAPMPSTSGYDVEQPASEPSERDRNLVVRAPRTGRPRRPLDDCKRVPLHPVKRPETRKLPSNVSASAQFHIPRSPEIPAREERALKGFGSCTGRGNPARERRGSSDRMIVPSAYTSGLRTSKFPSPILSGNIDRPVVYRACNGVEHRIGIVRTGIDRNQERTICEKYNELYVA